MPPSTAPATDDTSTHPKLRRCEWCRRVLPERKKGPGRPRRYCQQSCRQWHWVASQRAAELQLNEDELIMARAELDQLHDELYVLACAVEDTERDLDAHPEPSGAEALNMLRWLLDAAKPLRDRELTGSSVPPTKAS